jgi:hypothetical protein
MKSQQLLLGVYDLGVGIMQFLYSLNFLSLIRRVVGNRHIHKKNCVAISLIRIKQNVQAWLSLTLSNKSL